MIAAWLVIGSSAAMATGHEADGKQKNASKDKTAAGCTAASSRVDLDINNVRATLQNGGDMWWDLVGSPLYEVPKIDPPGSAPAVHSLFAGAIWIGGLDDGGNLKVAAQTYRQSGDDYWPGPLDNNASVTDETCVDYDRHWKVNGVEIDKHIGKYLAGTLGGPGDIAQSILEWPGKGNPYAKGNNGTLLSINIDLAPFEDVDNNGIYDPTGGDYPVINPTNSGIFADQMIFWTYNDKGNIHTESQGAAIGIQINALAFAFATNDEVNDMTFYRYTLVNKATQPLNDVYMGQWVDPDLGDYSDDYVGCDTSRDLGIIYNGDAVDGPGTPNYGATPPLCGVDYFEGPKDENGVELGLAAFVYYNNNVADPRQGDPTTAIHFYNYLSTKWKDGTYVTEGGDGYGGTVPTPFMFPGDPSDPNQWSECSVGNDPADRRFIQSSGPFKLLPGAVNNITVGVVWVRPEGAYPCPSFDVLKTADDKAQALFDNGFKLINGPDAPTLVIRELSNEIIISITNQAGSNNINESYDEIDPIVKTIVESGDYQAIVTGPGFIGDANDSTFTFEGYQIYQVINAQVSASDLGNPEKSRLIAQYDTKNHVSTLINYEQDDQLGGAFVPTLEVEGLNEGIQHSLKVTDDQFAPGDRKLVNHKNYYFAAVAYAHNNYLQVDPLNFNGGGQLHSYLAGRKNFKIYSAIPHIPSSGNGGTTLNSEFGDGVVITRIEGQGNGGLDVLIDENSVDEIFSNADNRIEYMRYDTGRGPITVKIYDPFKVQNHEFEVVFFDTTLSNDGTLSSDATWYLKDITTGTIIQSERDISRPNEQLFPEYGFSITINQVGEPGDQVNDAETLGFIASSVEYEDVENIWLSGIQDAGTFSYNNWVRSGQVAGDDFSGVFNSYHKIIQGIDYWHDPNTIWENVIDRTWAPYCMGASGISVDDGIFTHGPAFRLNPNSGPETAPIYNAEKVMSIDVVFTDDKSKWSRCVVLETTDENELSVGNINKGFMRSAASLDANGNPMLDGIGAFLDTGMSYFPGYAVNTDNGERLNILFGESSWFIGDNGNDMKWNPTSQAYTPQGDLRFGGKHFIYVLDTKYDGCAELADLYVNHWNSYTVTGGIGIPPYWNEHFIWTSVPMLEDGFELKSWADGVIPSEVRLHIRVNAPFQTYEIDSTNNTLPKYTFSTIGMGVDTGNVTVATDALDLINVVPNPYYAYSAYETNQLDNVVKFTNLPNRCTISIFSIDGTLIRRFERDLGNNITSEGTPIDIVNTDNSVNWDLKNTKNIPVSSGMYLIHVEAEGLGETTLKWFGVMRPIDLDTF